MCKSRPAAEELEFELSAALLQRPSVCLPADADPEPAAESVPQALAVHASERADVQADRWRAVQRLPVDEFAFERPAVERPAVERPTVESASV